MSDERRDPHPPAPAVLRLAELLVRDRWGAVAEALYREIDVLANAGPGTAIFVAGCGDGVTSDRLARRTHAAVTGADPDRRLIQVADARARAGSDNLTYEVADLDDLPFETNVFDCAIGAPGVGAARDPERAVAELVRVTKPMGTVLLIQPTWTASLGGPQRAGLSRALGVTPRSVMEWKRALREAGLVEIDVQDWGDGGRPLGRLTTGSMEAVAPPSLTWRDKVHIVSHAWRRAGLRGTRDALARDEELLRELTRERALSLVLFSGVKWPHARPA